MLEDAPTLPEDPGSRSGRDQAAVQEGPGRLFRPRPIQERRLGDLASGRSVMKGAPGPIVLLTDFGHKDPFVGIMKGVIAGIAPKAQVVDLCHEVPPQDVRGAAFQLRASVPYFPKGALFVCVVDPGVGSARKILWARTARHQFLA